jgi:DNA-binding LacI/PurR family transcriptional regulator
MVDIESALSGQQAARHWSALRPAVLLTNAGFLDDAGLAQLHAAGTTVVAIAHASQKQKLGSLPTIVFDDSMIGEVAVQHLIDRGCREITLIQPEHPATSPLARQRKVGAQRAARRTKSVRLSTASMGLSTGSAAKLASSWTRGHCPDGVFGFDDSHAGLLLSAMIDHGLRVPQQVALVGSDNSEVCEMLRPKLTSTAIDTEDLAASLVDPVLRALQGTWREGLAEAPWKASLYKRDT